MQGTPKRRGRKKGATVNKAQEIRKVAREMIDKGERPRPIKVVDILAAKGIKVASPQVSMALRGTGMELRPRPRLTPEDMELKLTKAVTLDGLNLAEEFVKRAGGFQEAIDHIVVLSRMGKVK